MEESHLRKHQQVVFSMDNVYGMIILLSIGLGGGTLVAMAELIMNKVVTAKENRVTVM